MASLKLPAEIWTQIFDLSSDEDIIFQYGLPNAMAESAWYKNVHDEWTLRTPQEALNSIQRRSYATKKAIILTCKFWRKLGSQFLFRCLFFDDPTRILSVCEILDKSAEESIEEPSSSSSLTSLGWWTRRIHLTRYYAGRSSSLASMESALLRIIKHCPNLEIFSVDWPMPSPTFGLIADTLTHHYHLRTVHWCVPFEALAKVIWAFDSLPTLVSVSIEFEPPTATGVVTTTEDYTEVTINLGSASYIQLNLPCLQQLSLRGYFQEFLEQATGWTLPSLRSVSFDCGNTRTDQPDVVAFLTHHGSELIFLDLYCIPSLDVATILDLCPMLICFCFNADWRLPSNDTTPISGTGLRRDDDASIMVHRPHMNITSIGLHGLMYAFGVGYAAAYATTEPLRSHMIRRTNDRNVAALTKVNFPKLDKVRALNKTLLMDLNKEDGPRREEELEGVDVESGFERWERWWGGFARAGVRLEDCTGNVLGALPVDEEIEEEDESEEEYGEDEFSIEIPPMPRDSGEGVHVNELRELLEECRIMAEEREESIFIPMDWKMST